MDIYPLYPKRDVDVYLDIKIIYTMAKSGC